MKRIVVQQLLVVFGLMLFPLITVAQNTSILEWRRWETTIVASRDYVGVPGPNMGNPYRDLVLQIRFTNENSPSQTFVQDAFWMGNSGGNTEFKVRAKLPVGSWKWRFESCTRTGSQTRDCSDDQNLITAQGSIQVSQETTPVNDLYTCGQLRQLRFQVNSGTPEYSHLEQSEPGCQKFTWFGDTAWTAPPREILRWNTQLGAEWTKYLDNRRAKNFTVVLVAPAPAWQPQPGDEWPPLPNAVGFSFDQVGTCGQTVPIPNNCSTPRRLYWDRFDTMVQRANDRGLVVAIVGVIDPVGLGTRSNPPFPNSPNAQDFARYLAARLAGSHVVFSPGFDTWLTSRTYDQTPIKTVMNQVGNAIKTAAPHVLVTNHLAGQSSCDDYGQFQQSGWLTFHLFQSGHAMNTNGVPGTQCPGRVSGETSVRAAFRRVRQMPLTLRGYSNPRMPVINGEAVYDGHPNAAEPDRRYRVRQAGYMSILSRSRGFTYGASRIWQWYQVGPSIYDLNSAQDMKRLFMRFRERPVAPMHERILNQIADPNHENKMTLGSYGANTLFAYLPSTLTSSISINTSGFANLNCTSSQWTKKWINPANNAVHSGTCTQNTATSITLKRPGCVAANADCDWLIEINKTSSLSASSSQETMPEVWADVSAEDGSSNIYGELPGSEAFVISSAEGATQHSPHVTRLANAYMVVWRSTDLEGNNSSVLGRLVDFAGNPLGEVFKINQHDGRFHPDPVIVSESSGNAVVVWSSSSQDGSGSSLVARRLDPLGKPDGNEIVVKSDVATPPDSFVAAIDETGVFVVGWEFRSLDSLESGVSLMRFDVGGSSIGSEMRILSEYGQRLLAAAVEIHLGQVKVSLMSESVDGEIQFLERIFHAGVARSLSAP